VAASVRGPDICSVAGIAIGARWRRSGVGGGRPESRTCQRRANIVEPARDYIEEKERRFLQHLLQISGIWLREWNLLEEGIPTVVKNAL
jgi:hypothetical protein